MLNLEPDILTIDSELFRAAQVYVKALFDANYNSSWEYHNYEHTEEVTKWVITFAREENRTREEVELLALAALFHDIAYCDDPENHEELSAVVAKNYLLSRNVDPKVIEHIEQLILSTKIGWTGELELSGYIRDADLYGIGSENHENVSETLRKEESMLNGKKISLKKWNDQNIEFFQNMSYYTNVGRKYFEGGKENNYIKLLELKSKTKSKSKDVPASSEMNKIALTQLKTTLRNNIDLSAIADNKANIMLSINAILITIAIPIMLGKVSVHFEYVIPLIILGVTSLVSMAYATIATRPIKLKGATNISDIKNKRSNLFFFGNYYKMDYDEFEKGLQFVMSDEEHLEANMMKDLFYLGKSLGDKFAYLRICFNVFFVGIGLTFVSLLFVLLMLTL